MVSKSSLILVAAALLFGLRHSDSAEVTWLTGAQFRQGLASRIAVTWANIPLRKALGSLSRSQRIAVVLDRRVDPGQIIELAVEDVQVEQVLKQLSGRVGMAIVTVDPIVYLGPRETADQIRSVLSVKAAEVARLPAANRSAWRQVRAWHWDDLAKPREMVGSAAEQAGVEIAGLDQIPHDLWGAADLPPMPLYQRLTLILIQYDLTFEVSGGKTSIRPASSPSKSKIGR